jgi:hypothetical protein
MEAMTMAHVKKGLLTPPPEWWKHLRWAKKLFWKKERKAARRLARKEAS